jgi:hypothetical protein
VTLGGAPYTAQIAETYRYGGREGRISQRDLKLTLNGTAGESFTQTFGYDELGNVQSLGYPQCTFALCSGVAASPRTVSFGYTRGFLSAVPGYASSISYHPNGLVAQVAHANGVTDTQGNDPKAMRRPASIASMVGTTTRWSSGAYAYDGAGNVVKIGTSWFLYDLVNRLTTGTVFTGATGGGAQRQQTYTYDRFGNIVSIGGNSGRATPTSNTTNRLSSPATSYDASGNLTAWNGNVYEYDPFHLMQRMKAGSEEWLYFYTAEDERVWSFKVGANPRVDRWTLRDLDGQVLREYYAVGFNWSGSVAADYVYRDGSLLAAETPRGCASLPPRPPGHTAFDHQCAGPAGGLPRLLPVW